MVNWKLQKSRHILMCISLCLFLGKIIDMLWRRFFQKKKIYEEHVSNQPGGVLYYMWMLPSKVMPYLHRLAAPLTETSIVHWNDFSFFLNLCTYYYFFIQVLFQCNFSFAQNYCSILLLHLTSNWCFGLEYTICICRYVQ